MHKAPGVGGESKGPERNPAPRRLAKLEGDTPVQKMLAAATRGLMIHEARRRGDDARVAALCRIVEARWFVVNAPRPYEEIEP